MFICFIFEATLYKADEKTTEEDLLKRESGTRQTEIVEQEGREIEGEKGREKPMDLIFWMGELECIQFYLRISFPPGDSEAAKHLRMCWPPKPAPKKAK